MTVVTTFDRSAINRYFCKMNTISFHYSYMSFVFQRDYCRNVNVCLLSKLLFCSYSSGEKISYKVWALHLSRTMWSIVLPLPTDLLFIVIHITVACLPLNRTCESAQSDSNIKSQGDSVAK